MVRETKICLHAKYLGIEFAYTCTLLAILDIEQRQEHVKFIDLEMSTRLGWDDYAFGIFLIKIFINFSSLIFLDKFIPFS